MQLAMTPAYTFPSGTPAYPTIPPVAAYGPLNPQYAVTPPALFASGNPAYPTIPPVQNPA